IFDEYQTLLACQVTNLGGIGFDDVLILGGLLLVASRSALRFNLLNFAFWVRLYHNFIGGNFKRALGEFHVASVGRCTLFSVNFTGVGRDIRVLFFIRGQGVKSAAVQETADSY